MDYGELPSGFNQGHLLGCTEIVNLMPKYLACAGFIGYSDTQFRIDLTVIRDATIGPGYIGAIILYGK